MPHYVFRGVNEAFKKLVTDAAYGVAPHHTTDGHTLSRTSSRNGDVVRWKRPVIIEYTNPLERVLFNQARDCSPFFHLYESLWMLAGRNDIAPLAYYISDFGQFSDDGVTQNGAYGYRWRHAKAGRMIDHGITNDDLNPMVADEEDDAEFDQLGILIEHLKSQPGSRRAVLSMWNVEDDLLKIGTWCKQCKGTGTYKGRYTPDDPNSDVVSETCQDCDGKGVYGQSRDTCCNLSIVFEIEQIKQSNWNAAELHFEGKSILNMTVFNRSNDLIFGALGANQVHFTVLLEYMAAHIGVEVGTYCQVSSNMHVYLDPKKWKPEKWLADDTWDYYKPTSAEAVRVVDGQWKGDEIKSFPLVKDPTAFDLEVVEFVERHSKDALAGSYTEPFLQDVAQHMLVAFHYHKRRNYKDALGVMEYVQAPDWRIVGTNWLLKRKRMWDRKNDPGQVTEMSEL